MKTFIIISCLLFFISPAYSADIYTYKDADGNLIISDQAPPPKAEIKEKISVKNDPNH